MQKERRVAVIRAFFAVNFNIDVLRNISETQRIERTRCQEAGWSIKWIAPPNLHIMIRYLGEISLALPSPLKDVLSQHIEDLPPIPLRACGFRTHWVETGKAPYQTIIVPVEDETGGLAKLSNVLTSPLEELGFKAHKQEPVPHILVGRVLSPGSVPLDDVLAESQKLDFGRSTTRELVFYQSDIKGALTEFQRLWHLTFCAPAVELPRPVQSPQTEEVPKAQEAQEAQEAKEKQEVQKEQEAKEKQEAQEKEEPQAEQKVQEQEAEKAQEVQEVQNVQNVQNAQEIENNTETDAPQKETNDG